MNTREERFKSLILEYQDKLYRFCYSQTSNKDDRKDLYQEILVRIWKGLDSFQHKSSISTWLFRLAVNTSIDFLRKSKNQNHNTTSIRIQDIEIADKSNNIESDLILSESIKFMFECINRLSFLDRTLISLYLEDLTYKEIAEVVGISEKNVSVKLHRIKKSLNQQLKDLEK
jgi:RNA polymerase sigma-70 factor (ECF subfamily)